MAEFQTQHSPPPPVTRISIYLPVFVGLHFETVTMAVRVDVLVRVCAKAGTVAASITRHHDPSIFMAMNEFVCIQRYP